MPKIGKTEALSEFSVKNQQKNRYRPYGEKIKPLSPAVSIDRLVKQPGAQRIQSALEGNVNFSSKQPVDVKVEPLPTGNKQPGSAPVPQPIPQVPKQPEIDAKSEPRKDELPKPGGGGGNRPDTPAAPGPNHSGHDLPNVTDMMNNHQNIMMQQMTATAISAQIQGVSAMVGAIANSELDGVKAINEIAKKGGDIATSAIG